MMTAVDYARRAPGVVVVSMSWGSGEFPGETAYDSYFTTPSGHAGVAFVASSGDYGSPVSYPSASPNVISIGGTSLDLSQGEYAGEAGWSGSGGGVSVYEHVRAIKVGLRMDRRSGGRILMSPTIRTRRQASRCMIRITTGV